MRLITATAPESRAHRLPVIALSHYVTVLDRQGKLWQRPGGRTRRGLCPFEDGEDGLVTGAEQLVRRRLIQTDRAPRVRAYLRERDEPFWSPILATGERLV